MEDFLRLSYENDEDAKKEIDNGEYKIFVEEKLIFRSIWEDLVRPGWTVDIRRNSQAHLHQDSASDTDGAISDEESDLNENDVSCLVFNPSAWSKCVAGFGIGYQLCSLAECVTPPKPSSCSTRSHSPTRLTVAAALLCGCLIFSIG